MKRIRNENAGAAGQPLFHLGTVKAALIQVALNRDGRVSAQHFADKLEKVVRTEHFADVSEVSLFG